MVNHNFIMDSFAKGTSAEEIAMDRIKRAGWSITDVRNDKKYQVIDIDLICSSSNDRWTVDVKTDRGDTGNYFIETKSNVERDTAGWGYSSEADYIMIVYPVRVGFEIHVIDAVILRNWLPLNEYKYRTITNSTKRENGSVYHSKGVIINRQKFLEETGAVAQIFSFDQKDVA